VGFGLSSDQYILRIIQKYSHDSSHIYAVQRAKDELDPIVKDWAGRYLISTSISGSFAKGTSITLGSDFDLFISLSPDTPGTLRDIYKTLYNKLNAKGYSVKRQNVSLGVTVSGLNVDVIPAKKQPGYTYDHSIYLSKKDSWTQTNVEQHINLVKDSGRLNEVRITKIWSKLHRLDFPSFYLELAVIEALKRSPTDQLASNFLKVLEYLSTTFQNQRFVDPANSNNIISDLLTESEKKMIAGKAREGYVAKSWSEVVW